MSIVVAATDGGVIGKDNSLPWRLPDDLKRFKQITMGKPIVMGRKTYDSIGRPLPGRTNIVVSRSPNLVIPGCTVVGSVAEAIQAGSKVDELCVIGGAEIYKQILPQTDRIYLTRVHAKIDGDALFPELPATEWRETEREKHAADDRHLYAFTFLILERKK